MVSKLGPEQGLTFTFAFNTTTTYIVQNHKIRIQVGKWKSQEGEAGFHLQLFLQSTLHPHLVLHHPESTIHHLHHLESTFHQMNHN